MDCLKLLDVKLGELHRAASSGYLQPASHFPRALFRVLVLYVSEQARTPRASRVQTSLNPTSKSESK